MTVYEIKKVVMKIHLQYKNKIKQAIVKQLNEIKYEMNKIEGKY